jgi:hypothetical protein
VAPAQPTHRRDDDAPHAAAERGCRPHDPPHIRCARTRTTHPAAPETHECWPNDIRSTRITRPATSGHTIGRPATSETHGSPGRRHQTHTDRPPGVIGAQGSSAQRRQAHTHGVRATPAPPRQQPANTDCQRATPPSPATTASAHEPPLRGPWRRSAAGPPPTRPQPTPPERLRRRSYPAAAHRCLGVAQTAVKHSRIFPAVAQRRLSAVETAVKHSQIFPAVVHRCLSGAETAVSDSRKPRSPLGPRSRAGVGSHAGRPTATGPNRGSGQGHRAHTDGVQHAERARTSRAHRDGRNLWERARTSRRRCFSPIRALAGWSGQPRRRRSRGAGWNVVVGGQSRTR